MTRSPTFRSVTSLPTLSITPATSAAGENGNGGLLWYLPCTIRMSKKFNAADFTATTTWPGSATGSGMSLKVKSSGSHHCEQRMAFMIHLERRKTRMMAFFMADLTGPDNPKGPVPTTVGELHRRGVRCAAYPP